MDVSIHFSLVLASSNFFFVVTRVLIFMKSIVNRSASSMSSNIRLGVIQTDGTLQVLQPMSSNAITINATMDASDVSSGALVVTGGIAVGKTITTGGNLVMSTPSGSSLSAITLSTTSGSDNKSLLLTSFGSTVVSSNRGSWISLEGLQSSSNGNLTLGTTGSLVVKTGTSPITALTISNTGIVSITSTVSSSSSTSGALVVAGGIGAAGTVTSGSNFVTGSGSGFIGGYMTLNGTSGTTTIAGTVILTNTSISTSSITGAFVVSGGIGVSGAVNLASTLAVSGIITLSSTTASTSIGTGTLVLSGGLGIAGNTYVGGRVVVVNTTGSTSPSSGSLVVSGGAGVNGVFSVGGGVDIYQDVGTHMGMYSMGGILWSGIGLETVDAHPSLRAYNSSGFDTGFYARLYRDTGAFEISSTMDASSATGGGAGSLRTFGGLSVAKSLYVGGVVNIVNTAASTGTTSGALVLSGGIGVGGNMYLAGGTVDLVNISGTTNSFLVGTAKLMTSASGYNVFQSGSSRSANSWSPFRFTPYASSRAIMTVDDGVVTCHGTGGSTSTTSGALVVSGGAGVVGASYFGSSLSADSLINRNATFVLGTTATSLGNSGSSRAVSKTLGNVLSLNVGGDFTGGVYIDGPRLSTLGSMFIGGTSPLTGSFVQLPAGNNFSYMYASNIGDGLCTSYNSISQYGASSWTINDSSQGTANVVVGNASIGMYTGAIGAAPTTMHLSIVDGLGTSFLTSSTFAGKVSVSNTTNATSALSAAFVVAGGAGIGGNVYVSGATVLSGQLDVSGNGTVYGRMLVSNTTASNSTSSGSLVVTGGLGLAGNLTMGANLIVAGSSTVNGTATFYGDLVLYNTTDSISTSTGSLVLSGGLGVAGAGNFGGSLGVSGPSTFANVVTVLNTTESYTFTTGCLTVSGGIGITKSLVVGGNATVSGTIGVTGNATLSGTLLLGTALVSGDTTGTFNVLASTPSTRLAATNSYKSTVYSNSLSIFTLGNTLLDTNNEALQISNSGTGSFIILTRSSGTGTARSLLLQSGGSNSGQITLGTDGTVSLPLAKVIGRSTNPSSGGGGALNLASGDMVSGGRLYFSTDLGTGGSPSLSTRSLGTRIVLLPNTSSSSTDVALGVVNGTDLWYSAAASHLFYSNNVMVASIDGSGTFAASGNINVGTGSSGNYHINVVSGASDTVRLAPSIGGGTVSIAFSYDSTFAATSVDGDIWYIGRNLFGNGATTLGFGLDGPSGQLLAMWIDNSRCVYIPNTVNSTMVGNGALVISGGASVASNLNIGGDLNVSGTITGAISSTAGLFTSTVDSTSVYSGSLVAAGGVGVAKSMYVGGHVVLLSTIASTSATTGALVISGGIGVSGDVYSRGLVGLLNTTNSVGISSGAMVVAGGISVAKNITCGGNLNLSVDGNGVLFNASKIYQDVGGMLRVVPTTHGLDLRDSGDSMSVLTYTDGGPCYLNLQTMVSFTGDSSASTTGAFIVSGGAGIAKSLYVGLAGHFGNGLVVSSSSVGPLISGTCTDSTGVSDRAMRILYPNLSTASVALVEVGSSSSTRNTAYFGFVQDAAGSIANYLTLGMYGVDNVLNIFASGKVAIGSVTPPSSTFYVNGTGAFTGAVVVSDTTVSTTTGTGSLVLGGGLGVGGNVHVGGDGTFTGNFGVGLVATVGSVVVTSTTDSTLLGQGSIVTAGGLSVAKSAHIGNELNVVGGSYLAALTVSGALVLNATTNSTSSSSGALVLAGGMGIAKDVYMGGDLTLTSHSTITSAYLTLTENVTSSGSTSGTLVCNGGVGIGGNMHVAGIVSIDNATASTSYTTGALVINGGLGISGAIYNDGNVVSTGAITSVSDARLKYDVQSMPVGNVFDKLRSIDIKRYKMKKDIGSDLEGKEYIGVIAQELRDIFPDLVHENESGMLSVDYSKMFLYWLLSLPSERGDACCCKCKRTY